MEIINSFIKKAFLIYILFLFTTLSGSPILATDSSPSEGELAFQQMKEQISEKTVQRETAFEEETLNKDFSVHSFQPARDDTEEKQPGVTPALIEIPAIDARATVVPVGQTADGKMEAPKSIYEIGWYEPGIRPGDNGNAVLAGHVDGFSQPGTFYDLKKLEPGDEIYITGTDGRQLIFRVQEKQSYTPQDAPIQEIFGGSSESHLNLITCTGVFDESTGEYEERLVIYTDLVES